jgi:hypothetical protein
VTRGFRTAGGLRGSRARRPLAVPALAALALLGCSHGGLSNMWRDPGFRGPALTHVFVVALKPDPVRRRLLEDAFVNDLAARGVHATPSYRDYASAPPDTAQMLDAIRTAGYDGVILSSRLSNEENQSFVPGYVSREAQTRYDRWTGQYYTYWVDVTHPGYLETETVVRHRVDVWATADGGRLVWSGVSERFDPKDFEAVSKAIVKHVVPELEKQGLVAKK